MVPLDLDLSDSVTTPSTFEVRWLEDETEESDGIDAIGAVVDCVVVELEDEFCARPTPVVSATAIVAASNVLIISVSPGNGMRAGIARFPFGNVALAIV